MADGTDTSALTSTKIGNKSMSNLLTSTLISVCTNCATTSVIQGQTIPYNKSKWINSTSAATYKC